MSSIEVVHRPEREVGIAEAADVDHGACETKTRDPVDQHEVRSVERLDPMLNDVEAANGPARRPTSHLDARWLLESVDSMQVRGRSECGVEARPDQRGDHHPLLPRRRRAANPKHAVHGLVEETVALEVLDLTTSQTDDGSLASREGTVLRGCELSNGAHGVAASHDEHW